MAVTLNTVALICDGYVRKDLFPTLFGLIGYIFVLNSADACRWMELEDGQQGLFHVRAIFVSNFRELFAMFPISSCTIHHLWPSLKYYGLLDSTRIMALAK
jgi:hypothetical protein